MIVRSRPACEMNFYRQGTLMDFRAYTYQTSHGILGMIVLVLTIPIL